MQFHDKQSMCRTLTFRNGFGQVCRSVSWGVDFINSSGQVSYTLLTKAPSHEIPVQLLVTTEKFQPTCCAQGASRRSSASLEHGCAEKEGIHNSFQKTMIHKATSLLAIWCVACTEPHVSGDLHKRLFFHLATTRSDKSKQCAYCSCCLTSAAVV